MPNCEADFKGAQCPEVKLPWSDLVVLRLAFPRCVLCIAVKPDCQEKGADLVERSTEESRGNIRTKTKGKEMRQMLLECLRTTGKFLKGTSFNFVLSFDVQE